MTHIPSLAPLPTPARGVTFRDVLRIAEQLDGLAFAVALLSERVAKFQPFDALVCAEAGGFLFAPYVLLQVGCSRVAIVRRGGKLPPSEPALLLWNMMGPTFVASVGDRVVMVDDVLATGKTLAAVVSLVEQCGASMVGAVVVAEFPWHRGRDAVHRDVGMDSFAAFPGE
ncbi:phosphoribosyltransferase-like protein [Blyttiomyces helicus]|uniref:adenine phosphoribosyltransferase n=1 Tax=Blyttiomyces helicus TaxID=388810 RepID=A0A4P9VX45_9FUNG|nr:phosphoribosyltransferase-like protein [Blyttiomyces helicus]|eukprot:RKO84291.1 phosphoribosyltransferase-like protein [Blyttiomyces helicus]